MSFTKSGLAPSARRHHFHSSDSCDFECSNLANFFNFFRHTNYYHSFLTFFDSDHYSSPDMHNPKHRSHCTQVPMWLPPPHIAVAKSAFQRKKLSKSQNSAAPQLRNTATLQHRTYSQQPPPTTPPTS